MANTYIGIPNNFIHTFKCKFGDENVLMYYYVL